MKFDKLIGSAAFAGFLVGGVIYSLAYHAHFPITEELIGAMIAGVIFGLLFGAL